MIRAVTLLALCAFAAPAGAQSLGVGPETGLPLPRFESLRFNEVNLRRGAGEDYPIAWTFVRQGLPVEVFQEYEYWRHVRDHEGATGWIKRTQLGSTRTALVQDEQTTLYAEPDEDSDVVAGAEMNAVLTLTQCTADWCEAKAQGYTGWVQKTGLWGVLAGEIFED